MFSMIVDLLLFGIAAVAASTENYWYHLGCFETNRIEYVQRFHWADCARIAFSQGSDTIGLMDNGQCLHCKNCFDSSAQSSNCPDYGTGTKAQWFILRNDSENIPTVIRQCSTNDESRCPGLHPFAYRRQSDLVDFKNQSRSSFKTIVNILPLEQVCRYDTEGQCYWSVSTHSADTCVSEFTKIVADSELPVIWPPPVDFPIKLADSLSSSIPLLNLYIGNQKHAEGDYDLWSQESLNESLQSMRSKTNFDTFHGFGWMVNEHYGEYVRDKVGVVLGSIDPWIEANLLRIGAAHVITVEYKPILSLVPDISVLTPLQLASRYLGGNWSPVDFAFSFSSVEHSGLGRYGDPVDGEGDLRAMRQISCLLKPGGVLFLSVPTGPDALVYNAHRIYGRHRLPVLFEGWEFLDVFGNGLDLDSFPDPFYYLEPLYVLRKPL